MKRASSQPLLRHFQETDDEEEEEQHISSSSSRIKGKPFRDAESISTQVNCITIHKRQPKTTREEFFSWDKYGLWRQEQKSGAAKLKKQLKARWAMHKLIDQQLARFQAHYNRAMAPTKMSNAAQLLMPKWAPALELAALSWYGDWRPTTILKFLLSLSDPIGVEQALSQLINDIHIEEAVIDEEMTEIQANCVLHLPFGPNKVGNGPALAHVRSEFKKIHRVMVKAQHLRMKALELAVKKVLSQTDAAEFLVDFAGIQDAIHQFAMKNRTRKGPVFIKGYGV